MRGQPEVVAALDGLLADEHAAIAQYTVHAAMASNWGYEKFAAYVMGRAKAEMSHMDKLIDRIIFLEATPTITTIGPVEIGPDLPAMLASDLDSEIRAVLAYNDAIAIAAKAGDSATRELLEHILTEEDEHVNAIEGLLAQVAQMGVANFLSTQV
jgi:bacterioferritin